MKRFATIILIIAATIFLAGVVASAGAIGQIITVWLWWMLRIGTAVLLALTGLAAWIFVSKRRERINRQQDGQYPLRQYRLGNSWQERLFGGVKLLVDPNNMVGSAAVIHPVHGYVELEPAAGWDRQVAVRNQVQVTRHLEAMNPGDSVLEKIGGMMPGQRSRMDASTGKLLAGYWDRSPRVGGGEPRQIEAAVEAPEESAPPVKPLALLDALNKSTPRQWLLGQSDGGKIAQFDLDTHHNIGVIGVPGTGKSHGTGYQLLLLAIRHGFHAIVLDGKGGIDFGMFDGAAEWHETDPDLLADQIAVLADEHERRGRMLAQHGASNMWELNGHAPPRLFVLMEEYGALQDDMRMSNPRQAERTNYLVNKLMRKGRATGIHFGLLDQDTEFWSSPVRGAAKCKVIYQVDESEAGRLGEYHAARLPERGAFMLRGGSDQYAAWHVEPHAKRLLASLPALRGPRLLEARRVEVDDYASGDVGPLAGGWEAAEDAPAARGRQPPGADRGKWDTLIENWFFEHPEALEPGPARGITDIARRMARADGDSKPVENYKGVASELFHAYRDKNRSE